MFDSFAKKDKDVAKNIETLTEMFFKHGILNIKQLVRDSIMSIEFDENNRVIPIRMY